MSLERLWCRRWRWRGVGFAGFPAEATIVLFEAFSGLGKRGPCRCLRWRRALVGVGVNLIGGCNYCLRIISKCLQLKDVRNNEQDISLNGIYIMFGNNSDNQNSKAKERTRSIKYKRSASKKYVTKSDVLTLS